MEAWLRRSVRSRLLCGVGLLGHLMLIRRSLPMRLLSLLAVFAIALPLELFAGCTCEDCGCCAKQVQVADEPACCCNTAPKASSCACCSSTEGDCKSGRCQCESESKPLAVRSTSFQFSEFDDATNHFLSGATFDLPVVERAVQGDLLQLADALRRPCRVSLHALLGVWLN